MIDRYYYQQLDKQDDVIGKAVTLNGKPAKIVRDGRFASVAPLDSAEGTVPYSWAAIFTTLETGGDFKTG